MTFCLIAPGFQRTFAIGGACQQRTLTPLDTWSCPTLGLACVLMWIAISPELVLFCLGLSSFEHPIVLLFYFLQLLILLRLCHKLYFIWYCECLNFCRVPIFMVFLAGPIHEIQYQQNSDFLYELWKKI